MNTFKIATPDGTELFRSSKTRVYSWAHVFYNKSGGRWGAHWSSRRDLAQKELSRHSDCAWLEQQAVVAVEVVEAKERAQGSRSALRESKTRGENRGESAGNERIP